MGAYHSEEKEFTWTRKLSSPDLKQKSVEAALMDWTDDIAYAIHDVEDFFRAGFIPLDRLVSDSGEVDRFLSAALQRLGDNGDLGEDQQRRLQTAFERLILAFPITEPYSGSMRDQATLKSFASRLIAGYVMATTLKRPPNGSFVELDIDQRFIDEVTILKELTWHYVIDKSSLATQQYGQRHIIRSLFQILADDAHTQRGYKLFPQAFREQLDVCSNEAEKTRIVIDYIASFTEHQAIEMFHRLNGTSFGSPLTRMTP